MTDGGTRPTFSIVVSVLNGAATLKRCLESVVAQTNRGWELVVIDGGSTDGTQEILRRFDESIVYWESAPDRGICHAWNKALEHAHGDWIVFLGADDRLAYPDVLAQAETALSSPGSPRVAYGTIRMLDSTGAVIRVAGHPWEQAGPQFFHHNTIPHQAVFHHRTLFERHGGFDESFRICGDYELLLRELKSASPRFLPGLVVAEMGAGGLSQQERNDYRGTRELLRAHRKNGLSRVPIWLAPRFLRATVYEILRRLFGRGVARAVADTYQRLTGTTRPRTP